MKTYNLQYSDEDCVKDYGFFTSRQKAEKAKQEILAKGDTDMVDWWEKEMIIREIELDKILGYNN